MITLAYISITTTEIMNFVDKNVEYNRDRLKNIRIITENHLEITIKVGPFFPDLKVEIVFNRFENGKMHFDIITGGGIKVLMGLFNEMVSKAMSKCIKLEKDKIEFDVNGLLKDNMKDVLVKSITISGEQIYAAIDIL